jgi:hypothetical protein
MTNGIGLRRKKKHQKGTERHAQTPEEYYTTSCSCARELKADAKKEREIKGQRARVRERERELIINAENLMREIRPAERDEGKKKRGGREVRRAGAPRERETCTDPARTYVEWRGATRYVHAWSQGATAVRHRRCSRTAGRVDPRISHRELSEATGGFQQSSLNEGCRQGARPQDRRRRGLPVI